MRLPSLFAALCVAASPVLVGVVPNAQAAEGPTCFGAEATIVGTGGRDVLDGTGGNDVIWLGGGADEVHAGGGDDLVCGGGARDVINGGNGDDVVDGEAGNDVLDPGWGFEDRALGGAGTDEITLVGFGAAGLGEDGNDKITAIGDEPQLQGGDGDDVLNAERATEAAMLGQAGNDRLLGSSSAEKIVDGGPGRDTIRTAGGDDGHPETPIDGGPGKDFIEAGGGTDYAAGGAGPDTIDLGEGITGFARGDAGHDVLSSAQLSSLLYGGNNNDRLTALAEDVHMYGETGDDAFFGSDFPDLIDGGSGLDEIYAAGGADTQVTGGPDADLVLGEKGTDTISGGAGNDEMDSGPGLGDVVLGEDGNDIVTVSADGGRGEGGAGDDDLYGDAKDLLLLGDADQDIIDGGIYAVVARGGDGNDQVEGTGGADQLFGGPGDDDLKGWAGADLLYGEDGVDVCAGGNGEDMCDGGPVGTDAPSPDDPDICKSDVESKHNCRFESGDWQGTGSGTLNQGNGLVESWSATYSMDLFAEGTAFYSGPATIQWSLSGTDSQGCSYSGAGAVDGRAGLALWPELGTYDIEVYRIAGETVPVTIQCPNKETEIVDYNPMNTNAAEGNNQLLPEAPVKQVSGDAQYVPMNTEDGRVTWSWQATRNS